MSFRLSVSCFILMFTVNVCTVAIKKTQHISLEKKMFHSKKVFVF